MQFLASLLNRLLVDMRDRHATRCPARRPRLSPVWVWPIAGAWESDDERS